MGPKRRGSSTPLSFDGSPEAKKVVLPMKSRSFRPITDSEYDEENQAQSDDEEQTGGSFANSSAYKKLAVEGGPLEIGKKLRNMLKLPKAYKWAVFEWFYSSIDRVLLNEENDFQICLKESFPDLKTRMMNRNEWRIIRRLLGKPRRCSHVFLYEERRALQRKRAKVRWLQMKRPADPVNFRDIPAHIPRAIPVGSKVTAYLYQSAEVQSGLYTGTVAAIDVATNLYRINFPKLGIGSFWISDAEVWCPDKYVLRPLDSFMDVKRQITLHKEPNIPSDVSKAEPGAVIVTETDTGLSSENPEPSTVIESNAAFGGFPIKFLGTLVHLTKLLTRKKYLIDKLCCENSLAEETIARNLDFTLDFQQKYASLLLELEVINKDLVHHLESAKKLARNVTPNNEHSLLLTDHKSKCDEKAVQLVEKLTSCQLPENSTNLITKLASALLQLKSMAEGETRAFDTKSLNDTLADMKSNLRTSNQNIFQRDVEVNVAHIQSSIKLFGSLQSLNTT